jgi:Mce-associated membrane protein
MTYPAPKKNRTNLIAAISILIVLVVGGVVAVVVTSGGDESPAPKNTAGSADTRLAAERDAALQDGRDAVEVFNTVDYRTVEADLDRWESVATGELLDEVKKSRPTFVSQVGSVKSTTTATVLDAALTDLDAKAGTARLIAAMSIDVTLEGQAPTNKRNRVSADLERTGDDWKVSRIGTL